MRGAESDATFRAHGRPSRPHATGGTNQTADSFEVRLPGKPWFFRKQGGAGDVTAAANRQIIMSDSSYGCIRSLRRRLHD